jgi:hypothetical protein
MISWHYPFTRSYLYEHSLDTFGVKPVHQPLCWSDWWISWNTIMRIFLSVKTRGFFLHIVAPFPAIDNIVCNRYIFSAVLIRTNLQMCTVFFSLVISKRGGGFFRFFLSMYDIQHGFICRPSDSTVSEDDGIELRTDARLDLIHSSLQ